jgi:hypothetical protein
MRIGGSAWTCAVEEHAFGGNCMKPLASPFLTVFELGVQQSEHPVKLWNKLSSGILGVLLVSAGITALLFAVAGAVQGLSENFGTALSAACIPGVICIPCLGIGAWCLYTAWNNWGVAVAVFDRGLAMARWDNVRQIPWEEVTAVWQAITKHYTNGIYTGTTHQYTIQLTDDTKYKLDDKFKDIETLGRTIQSNVTNSLYPKYAAALKAGSRLEFGPLALDYNKLYSGKKELSWDDVKSVKIQGGFLSVKKEKGWFRWAGASIPQIPNFFILYALLKEFNLVE